MCLILDENGLLLLVKPRASASLRSACHKNGSEDFGR